MDVFNVTTRRKDTIDDPAALQQAILDGTHAFSQGTSVVVKSPDGTMGTIPSDQAADAVRAGYQLETNSQRAVREYVDENKGLAGFLKVGLGQLVDEAAVGLPELIYNKTGDPLDVAKKEALKKEHGLANALGGITGFGASLLVGGPLWKGATKAGEKVGAHIAQKIAVETGKQTATKSMRNAGAAIAGKIGGAATEGAIVTLPHAITEAALGDPDAAAETMLAGVGMGALFGGAQGLGSEFLGLGKKVSSEAAKIVGEQDVTLKKMSRQIAQSMTGVNEDDILYYIKNRDKVSQAPAFEAIKDEIDMAVKGLDDDALFVREALRDTDIKIDMAYRNAQRDMAQTRAPQELADELVGALDNEKMILGQMSEEADDILAASGGSLAKQDIVNMIDDVQTAVVPFEVGEKATQTAAKLKNLKASIEEQFPDEIAMPEVREIIRQVRDDINYNQLAGEFNDRANKARKKLTNTISETVKSQVPEYAEQMAKMSERASVLEKMSKTFGSRERAASALNGMLKPGKEVRRELLDEFSTVTGADFNQRFMKLVENKDMLEAIKRGEDLRPKLLPNLFAEKERLEIQARNAKETVDSLRKIGPGASEQAIRRMGYKNPDINTRRAFEKLSELKGKDYLDLIKDRNILDQFDKSFMQGSRKTNLGAILGGAGLFALGANPVTAAVAGAAAAAGGAVADSYGGRILKNMLDRPNVAGLLFAEKAIKRTADEIDRIPGILERMSLGTREIGKRTIALDAIYRLTDSPNDKNTGEQLEKIGEKIRAWLNDPTQFEDMISKFSFPLAEGGAPNISRGLSLGAQKALSYLNEKLPKPPAPSSPFAPKITWNPSDDETNKFARAVQVAENPFSVLDDLENGSLTSDHVDALKNMFPPVFNYVQQKIMETAAERPLPLSYNDRVKLSILAEVPLDDSLEDLQFLSLQRKFMKEGEEQPDLNQSEFSPQQDIKMAQANMTTLQQALA